MPSNDKHDMIAAVGELDFRWHRRCVESLLIGAGLGAALGVIFMAVFWPRI